MTLKEYAKRRNISYEAVRKQVDLYREHIGKHLQFKGRTQYIDDEAVAFLDTRRAKPTEPDRFNELVDQNKQKDTQIIQLQHQIIELQDENKKLETENKKLKSRKWWQMLLKS